MTKTMPAGYIADTVQHLDASVARKGVADARKVLARGKAIRPQVSSEHGPSSRVGAIANDMTTPMWESSGGPLEYRAALPTDPRVKTGWARVGMLVRVWIRETGCSVIGRISAILVPIQPKPAEPDPDKGTDEEGFDFSEPVKPVFGLGYIVTVPVMRTDKDGVRYECGNRDRTLTPRDCAGRRPKYVVKQA